MSGSTHEVTNQTPPLTGHDVFGADRALVDAVARGATPQTGADLTDLGRRAGGEHAQELGTRANSNPPVLRTHDRYGHRVDRSSSTRPGTS